MQVLILTSSGHPHFLWGSIDYFGTRLDLAAYCSCSALFLLGQEPLSRLYEPPRCFWRSQIGSSLFLFIIEMKEFELQEDFPTSAKEFFCSFVHDPEFLQKLHQSLGHTSTFLSSYRNWRGEGVEVTDWVKAPQRGRWRRQLRYVIPLSSSHLLRSLSGGAPTCSVLEPQVYFFETL